MWNDEPSSEPIVPPKPRRISKSALVVSPHAFATAVAAVLPLFQERYEQHDAQEFLRVLSLHSILLDHLAESHVVCIGADAE